MKAGELENQQPQRLNIEQVLGGFIISSILLIVAFVVFLFEVMSKKCDLLKKLFMPLEYTIAK